MSRRIILGSSGWGIFTCLGEVGKVVEDEIAKEKGFEGSAAMGTVARYADVKGDDVSSFERMEKIIARLLASFANIFV